LPAAARSSSARHEERAWLGAKGDQHDGIFVIVETIEIPVPRAEITELGGDGIHGAKFRDLDSTLAAARNQIGWNSRSKPLS
jgi:hypothetical protein